MDWTFEQIFNFALNIVLGLAVAALLALIALVWKKAPGISNPFQRLAVVFRRAPLTSTSLSVIVLACIVIVGIGLTNHSAPVPSAGPKGVESAAPRSSPSATPAWLAEADWGPLAGRDLVKDANRPKTAMINSVIDHPLYGEERNFMRIRAADDEKATYTDSVIAQPGHVYEVGILIDNDAADGGAAAKNVRLRVQIPAVARGSAPSYAFVTSSNVKPAEVWDGVTLVGENGTDDWAVRYVAGSAVLHTGGTADGTVLPDDLFTKGALVGCDALDGVLPAGLRCQSWVTFKVRIDQPRFEVSALAQLEGQSGWSETFVTSPGQTVRVHLTYQNTGTVQQDNVVLKVKLPPNMHLVTGSTTSTNSVAQNAQEPDAIAGAGLNLGSYQPHGNVFVDFDMVVDGPLGQGTNIQKMTEFFTAETDNGYKSAPLTAVWF